MVDCCFGRLLLLVVELSKIDWRLKVKRSWIAQQGASYTAWNAFNGRHFIGDDLEVMQFFIILLLFTVCFSSSVLSFLSLSLQSASLSSFTSSLPSSRMRRSALVMRSIVPDKGVQSAWQLARRSDVRMPCVILVSPFVDGNVGSVSRCMLNWGLSELRIGEEISSDWCMYRS